VEGLDDRQQRRAWRAARGRQRRPRDACRGEILSRGWVSRSRKPPFAPARRRDRGTERVARAAARRDRERSLRWRRESFGSMCLRPAER
jgi:hypothetical protein